MTDPSVADAIYLEPLTVEAVEAVIAKERPEGLLAGLGGQTALNLATAHGRGRRLRAPRRSACSARRSRRSGWPRTARRSATCSTGSASRTRRAAIVEGATPRTRDASADEALDDIGLPAIVRPAFTLGGTGGGIVETEPAYRERVRAGLRASPIGQVMVEKLPRRLAGDRVRGHARRRRHVHRGVLDGERRPARRPHRRLDRRRAGPDADRRGPPAPAQRGARDHPGARRRGRLQRPVRAVARLDRVRGHRGQPARLALVGAGLEGDRLPDRPGRGPDRGRSPAGRDPERRDRHDRRRVRAGARLRRRQAAALPVRQVPERRPDARQPDEGDRRGDGHRPDLRLGAQQGAPRPRAGRRRAAGRGPDAGRPTFDYLAGVYAGDPDADEPIRWIDEAGQACESTRHAQRTAAPIVLRRFLEPSDSRLWRLLGLLRRGVPEAVIGEATGIAAWFLAEMGRNVALEAEVARDRARAWPIRRTPAAAELLATVKRAGFGDRELAGLAGTTAGRDPGGPPGARPACRATRWSTRAPRSSRPRRRTSTRPTPRPGPRPRRRRSSAPAALVIGSGPGPDRAGDRVRLLRGPGGRHAPPGRLAGGDDQLEPGDRLDRLRRLARGSTSSRSTRRASAA